MLFQKENEFNFEKNFFLMNKHFGLWERNYEKGTCDWSWTNSSTIVPSQLQEMNNSISIKITKNCNELRTIFIVKVKDSKSVKLMSINWFQKWQASWLETSFSSSIIIPAYRGHVWFISLRLPCTNLHDKNHKITELVEGF